MNALQCLRQRGRMFAADIADVLGVQIEDVYAELVMCESLGLARVHCTKPRGLSHVREWVAL